MLGNTMDVKQLQTKVYWIRNAVVSLLLFFLLWEWMRPLVELSDMTEVYLIGPFLTAIGSFIFIDYVRCRGWVNGLLKLLICLSVISFYFQQSFVFELQWWRYYMELSIQDGMKLLRGEFGWSPENRTLLFLLGWSFMISVIQSLMMYRQSGGFFIAATLLYLVILQFWAGLDTTEGVIRSMGMGLLLMTLLHFSKIERIYKVSSKIIAWPKAWMAASLLIIGIISFTGSYFTRTVEHDMKPIEWSGLQSWDWNQSHSSLISGPSKSGYGEDDTRLGGSVTPDDTIVFIAETEELTYWRGESKQYYDGEGWRQIDGSTEMSVNEPIHSSFHEPDQASIMYEPAQTSITYEATNSTPIDYIEQEVLMNSDYKGNLLFTGGLTADFQGVLTRSGQLFKDDSILVDSASGRYRLASDGAVAYYKVKVLPGNYKRLSTMSTNEDSNLETYLQLPIRLPERIKLLAEEITASTSDPDEQINLIENYLQSNYTYSLDKPVYPPAGQDFVDHFLFDQGVGYCDHFSTAMVVMLRTLGIPARWVKGFAPGEVKPQNIEQLVALSPEESRDYRYSVIVRNLDAHSWVEVFTPSGGWVAFDPTPGFALNQGAGDHSNEVQNVVDSSRVDQEAKLGAEQANKPWADQVDKQALVQFVWDTVQDRSKVFMNQVKSNYWVLIIMCAVCLISILAFSSLRKKWVLWQNIRRIKQSGKRSDAMLRLFESLWLKIFHRYGPIQGSQSIREYINLLELNSVQREQMEQFAGMYESVRYNSLRREWISRQKIVEVWKKIMG